MKFSPQQESALSAVSRWYKARDRQVMRVFGYAGTGKSTLARHFAEGVDGTVLFGAFSGKAAHVLRTKGCPNAGTIHSLIYNPRDKSRAKLRELQREAAELGDEAPPTLQEAIAAEQERLRCPAFELNPESRLASADLLVVDEVSMVGKRLAEHLLSFGVPVLVLGDPAQLPPVRDAGYFTNCEPDVMLTEIHRQARDNPIIDMATRVRQGETLPCGEYGDSLVVDRRDFDRRSIPPEGQVLCGLNRTRKRANQIRRESLGFTDVLPEAGDRLVCKRNNHDIGLLNGAIWNVVGLLLGQPDTTPGCSEYRLRSEDDGREIDVSVHDKIIQEKEDIEYSDYRVSEEFNYGYALTVHSAQGSQFDDVYVVDESKVFRQYPAKWLYTAVTRAVNRVTLIL